MEIARARFEPSEERAVVREAARDEVHDFAVALDAAVNGQQSRSEELLALALAEAAPDDHVHAAGFILQRDKYHAARRIRPLPAGHQSRNARAAAMGALVHFLGAHHLQLVQVTAQKRERMASQREAEAR